MSRVRESATARSDGSSLLREHSTSAQTTDPRCVSWPSRGFEQAFVGVVGENHEKIPVAVRTRRAPRSAAEQQHILRGVDGLDPLQERLQRGISARGGHEFRNGCRCRHRPILGAIHAGTRPAPRHPGPDPESSRKGRWREPALRNARPPCISSPAGLSPRQQFCSWLMRLRCGSGSLGARSFLLPQASPGTSRTPDCLPSKGPSPGDCATAPTS